MSRRSKRELSEEDRVLWSLVAHSATPLHAPRKAAEAAAVKAAGAEPVKEPEPVEKRVRPAPAMPPYFPPVSAPRRPASTALDAPTHGKLAKGRLPIEGRVDLHGLFQEEAYDLLLAFLRTARARGARHVLVITGKGSSSGGDGVLRRSVPGWLATAPFRDLVSGFDWASRGHGGTGALYLRLKRG